MKKVRILAIAFALIAALGVWVYMQQTMEEEVVITKNVVVVAVDVPQNTIITADMLQVKEIREEYVLPGTYTSKEQMVGKMSKVDLKAGEQIFTSRLTDVGNRTVSSLALLIEEGKRAVTISVDTVRGIHNMIKPGDKIDVLVHYLIEEEAEESAEEEESTTGKNVTDVLLENITVLAVDNVMSTNGKGDGYSTMTLLVTPEEASKVDWADRQGVLRAILRTPLDEGVNETPTISAENIIEE